MGASLWHLQNTNLVSFQQNALALKLLLIQKKYLKYLLVHPHGFVVVVLMAVLTVVLKDLKIRLQNFKPNFCHILLSNFMCSLAPR